MGIANLLPDAIERAGESFADGELAFIALTSKVERPFLDRLGYQLHIALDASRYVVAREFPVCRGVRADLAVLRDRSLSSVLEVKAMCTADCTRENGLRREYSELLHADLQRYATVESGPEIFCLLLGTHPLDPPPPHLASVVKYSGLLARAFRSHITAGAIRKAAETNLERYLHAEVRLAAGVLPAGAAFGVSVELLWWLYGPFRCPSELAILQQGGS